ncbi:MAG TPA: hypothetical protein VN641_13580 [Urbifossiella sp.]|nr:hypothetical protein [Urbifossiella sp.]
MSERTESTVLFLCTGNYYRSRFAEVLFNAVAAERKLAWKATSRGLALERGMHNIGPMARSAVRELEALGVRDPEAVARFPIAALIEDFEKANRVIALKQAEHLPLMQERFPDWAGKIEFWHIEDEPGVLGLIERQIKELAASLA